MKSSAILVVDDQAELREVVSRVLTDAGHRVVLLEDGTGVGKLVAEQTFDLVITDVIMPARDGMQVISELRRKHPRVRVIAMSGGGHIPRDQYLKIAKNLGAHAVLEKPFSGPELLATVERVLSEG